jgi:hypothetical protein
MSTARQKMFNYRPVFNFNFNLLIRIEPSRNRPR